MRPGDIVLKLSLRTLEEVESFSSFLDRFLIGCLDVLDRAAASGDPPFLMVASEPWGETDLRIVTFEQPALAAAFARGWDRVRGGGGRALRLI